jgi:Uma2 family endonuclease
MNLCGATRLCPNSKRPSSSKEWCACHHRSVSVATDDRTRVSSAWLFHYEARTPGVELGDNSTVHLDHNNTPQPDAVLFIQPESGGHVRIDEEGYIVGAPDLVAEVSASSVSYDLTEKLKVYERNGIREYIVWRVVDRQVNWLVLREAGYESLAPSEDGILRSTIFPGLWFDPSALLDKNFGRLLNVLDHGLDSPNHAEFVARLQQFEQRAN